ncbi:hypothetical protein [Streptomyces sp. NPDC091879]|jgi:hypothetical protein|uniref:hypothetical protein n=1 Tax=Streptomyces sp. NPDC091879 TaxID=3366006 RepID=UPI0037F90F18
MATDAEIVEELRAYMVAHGWSRPKAKAQAHMWFDFLAPRIREQMAEQQYVSDAGCSSCAGTELHDLLGHDALGHRTANSLIIRGVSTREKLVREGLEWVIDFTQVGTKGYNRIEERLTPEEYQRYSNTRWSKTAAQESTP